MSKRRDQMRQLTAMELALVLVARAKNGLRRKEVLDHPAWVNEFRWQAPPEETTIACASRDLAARGLIDRTTTHWHVTDKGRRHVSTITDELDFQARHLATQS